MCTCTSRHSPNLLFMVMLNKMMLPYQAVMVPVFIIFKELDWVGSVQASYHSFVFRKCVLYFSVEAVLSNDSTRIIGCGENRRVFRTSHLLADYYSLGQTRLGYDGIIHFFKRVERFSRAAYLPERRVEVYDLAIQGIVTTGMKG